MSEPRAFTATTKVEAAKRFMVCAKCRNGPLSELGCEWDHIVPWALSKDRSAENCQPLCRECHALKTNGPKHVKRGGDINEIARAKGLAGERKPKHKRTWPSRALSSRPFQKRKEIRT